jgi:FtsP/CotA-like multicopper oxidase with cupredoxin domain
MRFSRAAVAASCLCAFAGATVGAQSTQQLTPPGALLGTPPGPPPGPDGPFYPPAPPALLTRAVVAGAPVIVPNDNRRAAGRLVGGVLTVALDVRAGRWLVEGADGPQLPTLAFAESGGEPSTPGPLLRVPRGTEVRTTVRNRFDRAVTLYGLSGRGAADRGTVLAPGAEATFRFRADRVGIAQYVGRLGARPEGEAWARLHDDSQLHGVIVVDPPGVRPADRIFVISGWATWDPRSVSGLGPDAALAFNGRAWPHGERLTVRQSETVRWRFVNANDLEHPLHLHGAYFRVDARGDLWGDTTFAPAARRQVVTERLEPGESMAITWRPVHAGNWLLHCHFASHLTSNAVIEGERRLAPAVAAALAATRPGEAVPLPADARAAAHGHGASPAGAHALPSHMEGLVMGITVTPDRPAAAAGGPERALRLIARSRDRVYGAYPGYAYVLGGTPAETAAVIPRPPGPVLELVRGERVAITLVNRMHEAMAVHWHGIELESYPDGVPGWSGAGADTLPMIAPGDSLVVRFTPMRAGTFMYHSHAHEMQQLSSGLYGVIVVREGGAPRDTLRDRVLVLADGGPTVNFFMKQPPATVNGDSLSGTLDLPAGKPVRLRLVGIRTENSTIVSLLAGATPVRWRVVAKDGMPVPAARQRDVPARLRIAAGEIYDLEVVPRAGRTLRLRWENAGFPPPLDDPRTMTIRAR